LHQPSASAPSAQAVQAPFRNGDFSNFFMAADACATPPSTEGAKRSIDGERIR